MMVKNNKSTLEKYDDMKLNNRVMYSDEYVEGAEICGACIDGKCSESGERCDYCASTYQNKDYQKTINI